MKDKLTEQLDPAVEKEIQSQLAHLKFGVSEITPEDEFVKMLRHSLSTDTPLRVKCGIDPTGADVHLGHLVPYRKMRQFQDLGHIGVVIIGDYTASIGDPSGKNESRPPLDANTIKLNARKYMDQVYTVVDPDRTEVCHQTDWFEDSTLRDVLSWAGQTTAAKLLSHDTFKERLEKGFPLGLHELFYPVLQGVDSVFIKSDVELGGSDQRFNVLMGRDYQKNAGQRPQVAMLLPIITGTCGTQKMSKSLNNYIGILDEPFDKFGKVMSIPDQLMIEWYQYLTDIGEVEFQKLKKGIEDGSEHPNEAKKELAYRIVSFFHGATVGHEMREQFENVFKKKELPDDIPEFEFESGALLVTVLAESGLLGSKGEGRRLIKQKAVGTPSGEKFSDPEMQLDDSHRGQIVKVGKRKFLKLL